MPLDVEVAVTVLRLSAQERSDTNMQVASCSLVGGLATPSRGC